MSKPIYKFFMARFTDAWYQLSEEEQNSLSAKVDATLEKVGAKRLILCSSDWSSEQWSLAGAEEFPNIEAVQKHTAALKELNWFRYCQIRPCWALRRIGIRKSRAMSLRPSKSRRAWDSTATSARGSTCCGFTSERLQNSSNVIPAACL